MSDKRLKPDELEHAAGLYRVPLPALRAVLAVECGGAGFQPDGTPKILFEGHHAWKLLKGAGVNPAPVQLARPSLCFPKWVTKYYVGGNGEWGRLNTFVEYGQGRAREIQIPSSWPLYDGRKMLREWEVFKYVGIGCCSWGLPQMMGFNWKACGFKSLYEFKHAMEESESAQLHAMLRWLEGNGLIKRLRSQDWVGFARGYNGPGNVPVYSSRLKAAFDRYS